MGVEVNGEPIRYDLCPNFAMAGGLERFIEHGLLPGNFLTALLSNDLLEALGFADLTNRACIYEWAMWIYNHWPAGAKGSREIVDRIVEHGGYHAMRVAAIEAVKDE